MMRGASIALVLAACTASAPTAPLANQPAAPAHPATPAPTVAWNENNFDTTRLPAITADGKLAVLGEVDGDGARGNPNLRIVTIDRANVRTSAFDVMTVDEYGDQGPTAKLRDRVARANQILADLATQRGLTPLIALTTDADITKNIARGTDGLELQLIGHRLVIRRGAQVLVTRDVPPAWIDAAPDSVAGQPCEHAPYLGTVWLDEGRKLAIFTVNYMGTDTCWEPASRHHVLAW